HVLAAVIFLKGEAIHLLEVITHFPGILYFVFQFPIIGLLIYMAHDTADQKVPAHDILKRSLVSVALFALFAAGASLLLLLFGAFISKGGLSAEAVLAVFKLVFTIFLPVFIASEFVRQRLFFGKIYG
ncbi:MAG: hypothetical protein AAF740_09855, partial [Bacteroidota bacterium]